MISTENGSSGIDEACVKAQNMINRVLSVTMDWRDGEPQESPLSQGLTVNGHSHSIQSKLTRLYLEELRKAPHATPDSVLSNLENECDLLGRLVEREGFHTLIVNLYAGNKGYSLGIRNNDKLTKNASKLDKSSFVAETQLMGYEQGEFLSCIDNGQLPAVLAEQLERNHSHLFYDGCIIAEVRDYRKGFCHNRAEIYHVLLKPTTQSVLSDVSTLTNDGEWSHEERLILESRLIAATQGPLCLDPNPVGALASTRLRHNRSLLTDTQLVRQAKKYSQVTVNRKRKLEQLLQVSEFNSSGDSVIDSIGENSISNSYKGSSNSSDDNSSRNTMNHNSSSSNKTCSGNGYVTIQQLQERVRAKRIQGGQGGPGQSSSVITACPPPSLQNPPLLPPNTPVDVLNYAKAYERPRETKDCLAQLIEEYILETERGQGRIYHIKLSILQRPSNSEYLGELYVDRDYREGERNGSSCRFTLGTRVQANHYMQQFTEIFTEEGRKNVRIKHVVPGQAPRVTCTPGMQRAQQQQAQQLAIAQQFQQQILSRAQTQIAINNAPTITKPPLTQERVPANCQGEGINQSLPSQLQTIKSEPIVQSLPNGLASALGAAAAAAAAAQIDATCATTAPPPAPSISSGSVTSQCLTSLPTDSAPMNSINTPGILVFQQKSCTPAVNNVSQSTNVPVLQAQLQATAQNTITSESASQPEITFKKHSTNPAISALVTSLMNSAQQFQQQAAANAAAAALSSASQSQSQTPSQSQTQIQVPSQNQSPTQTQQQAQTASTKTNNAAILSLLNSSPANSLQQKNQGTRRISLNASIPPRVIGHGNVITVPNTTGQVRVSFGSALTSQLTGKQQSVKATAVRLARVQDSTSTLGLSMPGLSALLAGTPSADNPIPGINTASTLLERLTASSNHGSQPASPMPSPSPTNVSLQGVNLTNLPGSINGLQNVQVSFPGLSQSITMPLNVSAATASVTPTGVIVSLPISSGSNICTTVSSMINATVVTTAVAGTTPTVVIANPANTHLSLPIAQIIPSGVKGLTQQTQNIRNTNTVALSQSGQAIQLVGSHRPRLNQITRKAQPNQVTSAVLPNQLVTVAKTVTASQLILSGNKQVLTPIMATTKPLLMATQANQAIQATPSSQTVPGNKHALLTKSLHARASATGQIASQTQGIGVTSLSQQQLQQLQQCLVAQQKATAVAASNSPNRSQIQPRGTVPPSADESL
ncbi:uncharacterized protein Spt20 [Fopius arisanus]|uniref:Uncharacterized protein Spt20 n=2 Tax=Fopius arisanus TaxID=64838 RepID=A0A9R1TLU0_9HYME|nr:PREDICTED: uncharacterized protein LOC105271473 [Fopius arisanus]